MYQAIVVRVRVKPHPNADKIQLGTVLDTYQVVIGKDIRDNQLGVYFPVDGLLSHEFILANNLYSKSARQKLGLPDSQSVGFFDHHRRIRAQGFRGEKSDGFWLPLSAFSKQVDTETLVEGFMFDTLEGHQICEKWVAKAKGPSRPQSGRGTRKGELPGFPKHMDTDQWAYYKDQIPMGSLLTLSEKLHGTSHRVGLVLEDKAPWWRFWGRQRQYVRVDGSRNVVLTDHTSRNSFYESDEFRSRATPVTGRKGEVLYGEIVGWVSPSTPIMPPQAIDRKELPAEHDRYGDTMHFTYGQGPGESKFYVYRIVQFNEDGDAVELSDNQVRRRAQTLGYDCPPLIGQLVLSEVNAADMDDIIRLHTGDPSTPSLVDPTQIAEGIVIRVDDPHGHTKFYKSKSFAFKVLEGIIKSREEYVDREENA